MAAESTTVKLNVEENLLYVVAGCAAVHLLLSLFVANKSYDNDKSKQPNNEQVSQFSVLSVVVNGVILGVLFSVFHKTK